MTPSEALIAFVADVSFGDRALDERVADVLANPPEATAEALGFYPLPDMTPLERSFRRTVADLEDGGYIRGYEDKYVNEMLAEWLSPDVTAFIAPESAAAARIGARTRLVAERLAAGEAGANVGIDVVEAARDIEAALAADGKRLMSVDLDGGDTLFAFTLPEAAARRWSEVRFVTRPDGSELAVRRFSWDRFAEFLAYALRDDDVEVKLPADLAPRPLRSISDVGAEP